MSSKTLKTGAALPLLLTISALTGCAGLETRVDSPFLDVETKQVYPEIPEPVPPLAAHEIENSITLHEGDPALMCDQLLAHGVAESSPRKYDEKCGVKSEQPPTGDPPPYGETITIPPVGGCPTCEECEECVECPVCDTSRLQQIVRDLRDDVDDAERFRNALCDSLIPEMVLEAGKDDRFFGSAELHELGAYWEDHRDMLRECVAP